MRKKKHKPSQKLLNHFKKIGYTSTDNINHSCKLCYNAFYERKTCWCIFLIDRKFTMKDMSKQTCKLFVIDAEDRYGFQKELDNK